MNPDFPLNRWRHRVRIFDLDAYGHVNHTVFLQWLEEGRERLLREQGFSFLKFLQEGASLVMAHLNVDYKASMAWGDEAIVETRVARMGQTSLQFGQRVISAKDTERVLEAEATMVFTSPAGRPVPIPPAVRKTFRTRPEEGDDADTWDA